MEREDGRARAQLRSVCILQIEMKPGFMKKIQSESNRNLDIAGIRKVKSKIPSIDRNKQHQNVSGCSCVCMCACGKFSILLVFMKIAH